ncbi:MAG: acetyl-CoA carboxylase carboxyltransferase subunit alpha [Acholeplasmataceae bacterium]|nr:acetyl-CoA carboxylase carboxyltransferase subunit alpha [Acholeplasmataceae bacterium]
MSKSAWEIVKLARHPKRMTSRGVIDALISDFVELKGDRLYRDDQAIIGGIGKFNATPVTIIAQEKGITTEEKIYHNFGMPHPEGYHKALRLMRQAEKFNRPILSIIDTPGAYPGIGAEERGQARAIAYNLQQMMDLTVPIIIVVLGEGGSGGALGVGVGDYVCMFENAIYSILSPEGFASIIYRDSTKAEQAANMMKITAQDLLEFGIIEEIIVEGEGLHLEPNVGLNNLKKALTRQFNRLLKMNKTTLLKQRYQKFRDIGVYEERGDEEDEQTED